MDPSQHRPARPGPPVPWPSRPAASPFRPPGGSRPWIAAARGWSRPPGGQGWISLDRLRRLVRAGLDFPRVYVAHVIPKTGRTHPASQP